MDIYNNSAVNVIVWSESYKNKPKDSIVNLEKTILWDRHVGKSEDKSLFILNVDDTIIPKDFEICLIHNLRSIGPLNAKEFIVNRLLDCYKVQDVKFGNFKHPDNVVGQRGKMLPFRFRLSCNYRQDGLNRWNTLGDLLIVPLDNNVPSKLKTFLIPSAATPPFLSHSTLVKTNGRVLSIKQRASEAFAKVNMKLDLIGVLFYIENNGMEYPHAYCSEYDKYLIENWQKYSV
ncbi:hypothetical protein RZY48_004161 [Vibrio navarrensis]|uniref:Uncharacterized protein n=1 Tax=Vibrio navarrensis TaxID=29495 RepID=A0AAI9CXU7_9VIBR|nr:hypothetical protein [Vibrio navarrensis]